MTVTNTQGPGFILIYPQGSAQPTVSTLNYVAGQTVANAAVVPLGTAGGITVIAGVSGADLILDTNGDYRAGVVTTLNTLSGNVNLAAGSNVTITPSGQTLTVAATGGPGGLLPTGTTNQTLRHNGSSWVASSVLTNDGTHLEIGGITNLQFPRILAGNLPFLHAEEIGAQANTYLGLGAGDSPTPGIGNTAVGHEALRSPQGSSSVNVAVGENALVFHQTGNSNVAVGVSALHNLTSGSGNIAIGTSAGLGNIPGFPSLTTGSNNIYIGNRGSGDESGQIRIGTNGVHTQGTVIASIHSWERQRVPVIATPAEDSARRRRARYKKTSRHRRESDGLMRLRPSLSSTRRNTSRRAHPSGLIAEELPRSTEMVVSDKRGGRRNPLALLEPLLLNEIRSSGGRSRLEARLGSWRKERALR